MNKDESTTEARWKDATGENLENIGIWAAGSHGYAKF